MFSNLLYTLLGDCCFTSRRNAENFSKSLRSMSAKYIFGQDSWKYFRAVEYAAYVFCFFLQSTSTRIGSILPDRQADTLRPFPPFEVVRPFWMTLFPTIHDDQISPHPTVHGEHDGAVA